MSERVDLDDIVLTIDKILKEHGELIYQATEEGLDKAEKILIDNLKEDSPKDTKGFAKSWKGKKKKYRLVRYVGNTKMVKGKKGEIPLSNILEYSTKSPHQGFIKATYNKSLDKMITAIIDDIKGGTSL